MACLYIFLDEGGDFNFLGNGSKYFNLTSFTTFKNWKNVYFELDNEKYNLLEYGINQIKFHSCEDNKYVRNKTFVILKNYLKLKNSEKSRLDSVIFNKSKLPLNFREEKQLYSQALSFLLRHVFTKIDKNIVTEVVVITDNLPINKKRKIFRQQIKSTLKEVLSFFKIPFKIYHHPSSAHYGLQIADYCNWAILRKWEREDCFYYEEIKQGIRSEKIVF